MDDQTDVTRLLSCAARGDSGAVDELLPLVYEELRALATNMMSRERPDHTLQATAVVHEAYLRLVDQTRAQWRDRAHFFAIAGGVIRRLLVDHARGRLRAKRGGDRLRVPLDEGLADAPDRAVDLLALHEALTRVAERNPEHAMIVEMRFFAGLSLEETAEVLGKSTRTIEREWRYVRACLYRYLGPESRGEPQP